MTLVASKRPPSPTSMTAASAGCSENSTKVTAVRISNTVIVSPRLAAATRAHRFGQHLVLDQPAAARRRQPIAFVPVDQMRRGVDMDPVAGGLEQRPRKGGGRSLAVGAGDVDHRRQAILRIAEPIEQPRDAVQRKVETLRMQRHQALDFPVCGGGDHAWSSRVRLQAATLSSHGRPARPPIAFRDRRGSRYPYAAAG